MYTADIIDAYGYTNIFCRASTIREFFNPIGLKAMFADTVFTNSRLDKLKVLGEKYHDQRIFKLGAHELQNEIKVDFFWSYGNYDFEEHLENRESADRDSDALLRTADTLLINDKIVVHVPSVFGAQQLLSPTFVPYAAVIEHLCKVPANMKGKLVFFKNRTNYKNLSIRWESVDVVSPVDFVAEDHVEFPFEVETIGDVYCMLPLLKIDPRTMKFVKKTREEIVKSASKFMLEKTIMRIYGNPGSLIKQTDNAFDYLLSVVSNAGLLSKKDGKIVKDRLQKSEFDVVEYFNRRENIEIQRKYINDYIDSVIPSEI